MILLDGPLTRYCFFDQQLLKRNEQSAILTL